MIIDYRDKETRRRCEDESYMRSKFSPSATENLKLLITRLVSYPKFEVFQKSDKLRKKYRVHNLKGKKKDLISLSFSDKGRVTVRVIVKVIEDEITIWEVSPNHYGD